MSEYLFPAVDRVVYRKAPLAEVICQVRFPADLRIDAQPPVEFQQRVRALFPILARLNEGVHPPVPADVVKAMKLISIASATGSSIWQFSTEDDKHKLQLVKDNLTLISLNYGRWETFFRMFDVGLTALREIYGPPFFLRIGLRYRDLIQRSALGLQSASWTSLLRPHIVAELGMEGFEARTDEAYRALLIKLPAHDAKVRLQHGLAEVDGSEERAYLIDCDFFVERTEVGNAVSALEYFHGNAARFFRWCITEQLHRAMEPESVVS